MQEYLVVFQPSGKRGHVTEGTLLSEAARQIGEDLESLCGGQGSCGRCLVRIEEGRFDKYGIESRMGHLSALEEDEKRVLGRRGSAEGHRLACVARVQGDVVVFVPEETRRSKQVVRKEATGRTIEVKPAIRNYYVELTKPALNEDVEGDWERLSAKLKELFDLDNLAIDYQALRALPGAARAGGWRVTVTVWDDREVVAVRPGMIEVSYGLAVDVGTTTVAGYLCDLASGAVLATASLMNPQLAQGEDLVSRVTFAKSNPDGLQRLNHAIIEALNEIARITTEEAGLSPDDIMEAVLVGNTVMHHIFLNIDPQHLVHSPFVPALQGPVNVKARELGLRFHPGANVHVLPVEAGFVGADNVAALLAEEPYNQDEHWLIVDIGTNGEIVLGNRDQLLCASCACGPAFEGGHVRSGTRAAQGAIERVRIDPKTWEVRFKVIGREEWSPELPSAEIRAKGICGSGVIDAVAEMVTAGIIQHSGRLNDKVENPRLRRGEDGLEFVLAWPDETASERAITISQKDLQAITLAKAALYSGSKMLLKRIGLESPDRIILAGAFGSYIDRERAVVMGLLPDCHLDRIHSVGNAAGDGALIALLNIDKRAEAETVARRVEHVELTLEDSFNDEYFSALFYPHRHDTFPRFTASRVSREEAGA